MDELTNLLGNGQLSDSKEAISALIREFYTDFNGNELEVLSELEKYDRSMLQNIDHYECQKGGIKKSYG
ncbi:hypothetical protein A9Q91_03580 [Candidatus Gracilibacteria bacterium 28_42_T64]|nr:hypothetical protein A9Q91_03580 [Candidatus Gracilibacteria bacterium 28_42_T64]